MLAASRTCASSRPFVRSASTIHFRELAAAFGQLRFERVENFLRFLALGVVVGGLYGQVLEFGGSGFERGGGLFGFRFQRDVAAGENRAELAFELAFQFLIALRFRRLALERIDLAGDFFQDVEHAGEILLGAFEFGFGEAAAALVFRDARGFFDDGAAVLRFRREDLADAALLDDRVAFRAEAAAHEDVLNVAQAGLAAIDQVFAFAGAEQAAGDGDFARLVPGW